jgi:hypothetical protein
MVSSFSSDIRTPLIVAIKAKIMTNVPAFVRYLPQYRPLSARVENEQAELSI